MADISLSLNGGFNYPVELKQTFSVDGAASFNSTISHGEGNHTTGDRAFTSGKECSASAPFSKAFGKNSSSNGEYALSNGEKCRADGDYSIALGSRSQANSAYSFVWHGKSRDLAETYPSCGIGTFNIYPDDGSSSPTSSNAIKGFYVGGVCITDYISAEAAKRILDNENAYTAPQSFLDDANFLKDAYFSSNVVLSSGSTLSLGGISDVLEDHNGFSYDDSNKYYVASKFFAMSAALSSISNIGKYYPDMEHVDVEALTNFPPSLGYMYSYVTSAFNNVNSVITVGNDGASASRGYAYTLAESVSSQILRGDNRYTGNNIIGGNIQFEGQKTITAGPYTVVDLRQGALWVNEDWRLGDSYSNRVATQRFCNSVGSSAVSYILGRNNTYTGKPEFTKGVLVNSTLTLGNNSLADFRNGRVWLKEPTDTSPENQAATIKYSRDVATAAVDKLINQGAKIKGNFDFRYYDTANVLVRTQDVTNESLYAASTKYVANKITNTLSTSADAVREMILNGQPRTKQEYVLNDYHTINRFMQSNIYVSTMGTDCSDNHAASCEFVKNVVSTSAHDLFDIKFMDYELPESSPWKKQGSILTNNRNVFTHIYEEWHDSSSRQMTYSYDGTAQTQVKYRKAKDGHCIVNLYENGDMADMLDRIYATYGVVWFYVLDPRKTQVRLPRTKYYVKVAADINALGGFTRPSLPPHHHWSYYNRSHTGAHGEVGNVYHGGDYVCSTIRRATSEQLFDTTPLSTGDAPIPTWTDVTVQPPSTSLNLYFYCG